MTKKSYDDKMTDLERKMLTELASASPAAKETLRTAMRMSKLRKRKREGYSTQAERDELMLLENPQMHRARKAAKEIKRLRKKGKR